MEVMKHQFSTHFPQKETETLTMSEDPAKDPNFRVRVGILSVSAASCLCQEAEVDMLRTQKDEDLSRYRREAERRGRSWNDIDIE